MTKVFEFRAWFFLSLVSFFAFITNKRQPRFSIHAHAHTRHSPYKKFRVGKYKWSSTVSLFCFIFLFFFFFVLFLILNSFSQTFGFEKTVAPLYFKIFFSLSLSLYLSLSLLSSLSFILTSPSLVHTILLTRISFFPFFLFASFISFFFVVVVAYHLHDYSLSRVSYLSYYTFCFFFFTSFKSQLRY